MEQEILVLSKVINISFHLVLLVIKLLVSVIAHSNTTSKVFSILNALFVNATMKANNIMYVHFILNIIKYVTDFFFSCSKYKLLLCFTADFRNLQNM